MCIAKDPNCEETFCPLNCPKGEKECPSGIKPNGCPKKPMCVKKSESCPTFCTEDEITCEVNDEIICVDKLDANNCPGHCPVVCDAWQVVCPGPIVDGCPTQDICTFLPDKLTRDDYPAICDGEYLDIMHSGAV